MKSYIAFMGAILISSLNNAFALDFAAVGSGTYGGASGDTVTGATLTSTSKSVGFGGGILVSQGILPSFSLESGLLYQTLKGTYHFSIPASNATVDSNLTATSVRIPVLLNYHFLPMFSAGLGAYYSHAIGNIKGTNTTTVGTRVTSADVSKGWDSLGLKRDDAGILASVALDLPITTQYSLYSSVRAAYGLMDMGNSTNTLAAGNFFTTFKEVDLTLYLGLKMSLL